MEEITVAVIGAGQRGNDIYATHLKVMDGVKIVAVAEPNHHRRQQFKDVHHIADEFVYEDYQQLLRYDKFCDAVLICTNDDLHLEVAKLALEKGYHILLEKPMVRKEEELAPLEALIKKYPNQIFMVCHVLRYTPFFSQLRALIEEGVVGEVVSIQHNENIGYYHVAHSYVRGNWRREDETSPIILAKSCHDLDILNYLVSSPCTKIASFGRLLHFTKEKMPKEASERCINCAVEKTCPYSALKIYMSRVGDWPATVLTSDQTESGVMKAITEGPYGRCVYECDNDVLDHQVTILEYENGVHATFNLSGFTHEISRTIKIMGSTGELRGHMERNSIEYHNFITNEITEIKPVEHLSGHAGHGGGDERMIEDFVEAIRAQLNQEDKTLKTSALESLMSHKMAFAAERSRKLNQVVMLGGE